MGVNPLNYDDVHGSAASLAIYFAGPILGLINLIPILPLDGGNIMMTAVDVFLPGRSRLVMERMSKAMQAASDDLDFEVAARYRDRIR